MADRILTWSVHKCTGNPTVMLPSHYIEADFAPVAVRIYAVKAPDYDEAKFEIYDDGVSIMEDHAYNYNTYIANTATYSGTYEFFLGKNENAEEMAENFKEVPIETGSWLTCVLKQAGGGMDFTVILELDKLSEEEDSEG